MRSLPALGIDCMHRLALLALAALPCACQFAGQATGPGALGAGVNGTGSGSALDASAGTRLDAPALSAISLTRSGSREVRSDWPEATDPASEPSLAATLVLQFELEIARGERLRTEQELLPPLLVPVSVDLQSPAMLLHSEEQLALEEQERVAADGPSALGRPMQGALRNSDLGIDLEEMLTEVQRGGTAPGTRAQAGRGLDFGTPGLRLRIDRSEDPLELTWRLGGLRAGASLETARIGFEQPLRHDLSFVGSIRARHEEGELGWRTGVLWRLGRRTRVDALTGTGLDFLPATGMHARYESPLDGSRGVLVQFVHRF